MSLRETVGTSLITLGYHLVGGIQGDPRRRAAALDITKRLQREIDESPDGEFPAFSSGYVTGLNAAIVTIHAEFVDGLPRR